MKIRFIKYALVGSSGVLVNLTTLYLFQNFVFRNLDILLFGVNVGLNLSLAFAILTSLSSNFILNKNWTWHDRRPKKSNGSRLFKIRLFIKYASACGLSIAVQFVMTNILVNFGLHYMISSLVSIGLAAVFGFILNHKFTFRSD